MDKDPLGDTTSGMPFYHIPVGSPMMPSGTPSGISGMPGITPMPMLPGMTPGYTMPPATMPNLWPPQMPCNPGTYPMEEEMMEMKYIVALLMLHIDMCMKHMHMYHGI